MKTLIGFEEIEDKIITLRGQKVLLDRDVAALYGVETRDINKSVKNNPDKFPKGYIIELNDSELGNCGGKIPPQIFLNQESCLKPLQRKVFICLLPF